MTLRIFALVLAVIAGMCLPARADSVVTLCNSDRQAGNGTNLAAAIRAGGLIVFNCGGTATIRMSATHPIERPVVIDGGGGVTLVEGSESMFSARVRAASLELKNLRFQDTRQTIVEHTVDGAIPVTVTGSTFTNCEGPFRSLGSGPLVLRNSVFTNCVGNVVTIADNLTIERTRFEGTRNPAGRREQAVFSAGNNVKVIDSVFVGNQGGAMLIGTGSAGNSNHTVEIIRGLFENNGSFDPNAQGNQVGGVTLFCDDLATRCTLKVASTKFNNNRADSGAALFASGAALVSLSNARFDGNVADGEGGAVLLSPRKAADIGAKLEMRNVVFKNNRADVGGAARVIDADIVARTVTFSKNVAKTGGAIAAQQGAVQIDRGVFVDNTADGWGSALSLFRSKPSTLSNTLMARNRSKTGGAVSGRNLRFVNSTIIDNVGIGVQVTWQGDHVIGRVRFLNTIISGNSGGNCRFLRSIVTRTDRFVNEGHNLQFPDNSCGPSIAVANPQLDTLYLPVLGGPAFALGDNAACLKPPVDARDVYGKRRPLAAVCSIGAAEGELEKDVADRTTGTSNWPGGLEQNGSKTKGPPRPGTPGGPAAPSPCCCCCNMGSCPQ